MRKDMENIFGILGFLENNEKVFDKLESHEFLAMVAMMLEEWCYRNNEDVVEVSQMLAEQIKEVNQMFGKYKEEIPL